MKFILLVGVLLFAASCASSPYLQEVDRVRIEGNAIADPEERHIHSLAQSRYMIEGGARPFEVVLAEEKRQYEESLRMISESAARQRESEQRIIDLEADLERTMLKFESRRRDRLWEQETKLRALRVGDNFSYAEVGVPDRTIDLADGGSVLIFERLQSVGVNTTVTVDVSGKITEITRYP